MSQRIIILGGARKNLFGGRQAVGKANQALWSVMSGEGGDLYQKMALPDCAKDWIWRQSQADLCLFRNGLLPGVVGDAAEAKWPLPVDSQRSILDIWKSRVSSASL